MTQDTTVDEIEILALEKESRLKDLLRSQRPLAIAFSGGVDSAYLLAVAVETCGNEVLGVIADSASLPRAALAAAVLLAEGLGAQLEILATEELENPEYSMNPPNRCYFCKAELFQKMEALAVQRAFKAIAYGENADDVRQLRPGSRAAQEFAVLAPLREVGLSKAEIRILSRRRQLPTAEMPAQPCLSSRIPHGTPVTREALRCVEEGEAFLKNLGFEVLRVRYVEDTNGAGARVLVGPGELDRLFSLRSEVETGLHKVGFGQVELDPEGYHQPPELVRSAG